MVNSIKTCTGHPQFTATGLFNFIDKLTSNLNALKALNSEVNHYELILMQLVIQKLDSTTIHSRESTQEISCFQQWMIL